MIGLVDGFQDSSHLIRNRLAIDGPAASNVIGRNPDAVCWKPLR
jgi:hypothetical protein